MYPLSLVDGQIPAEEQPMWERDEWHKAHLRELGGQVAFATGGVALATATVWTAVCFGTYVDWQQQCRGPARVAVLTTALTAGGGALAMWGAYGEAHSLDVPWVEGAIGVGALAFSLPMFAVGTLYLFDDRPQAVPLLLTGFGLMDLGVAETSCQVHLEHREARRVHYMNRSSLRLRRDFLFCGFMDAFSVAVQPTGATVSARW